MHHTSWTMHGMKGRQSNQPSSPESMPRPEVQVLRERVGGGRMEPTARRAPPKGAHMATLKEGVRHGFLVRLRRHVSVRGRGLFLRFCCVAALSSHLVAAEQSLACHISSIYSGAYLLCVLEDTWCVFQKILGVYSGVYLGKYSVCIQNSSMKGGQIVSRGGNAATAFFCCAHHLS